MKNYAIKKDNVKINKKKDKKVSEPVKEVKKKRVELIYTLKVHKDEELLNFMYYRLSDIPKSTVKRYLENRQVLVNGTCITQFNFPLYKDDCITITKLRNHVSNEVKSMKLDIIYEDNDILAINKPSGLLSIESDKEKEVTAYSLITEYLRRNSKTSRAFIVHRIDKDTSGVLIVAKNNETYRALSKHWNDVVEKREYIAICEGKFEKKSGHYESYLKENVNHMMYSTTDPKNSQLAITDYKVLKEKEEYSLLSVSISTGRKNQIRVHMGDLGHKVVGDEKYKSTLNPINRLGLHAYKLVFIHPTTKKKLELVAKIPKEFNQLF